MKRQMEKTQREYYLNEQMKAIQKELGELEDGKDEASELEARIKKTKLSKEAREKAKAELKKLRTMSPMSAEATVVRNYLDWMLSLPWKKRTKVSKDIKLAQNILDADHYGLEKVKERIVEYLAVQQRVDKMKGPILCLVGPPGRGQDLARQVAGQGHGPQVHPLLAGRHPRRGRDPRPPPDLHRLDAGQDRPVDEEGEDANPLFMLDEIDKMGDDFRGDPSSALLEVLDPEQNINFNDHYLEVDYDLSDVMFVCTANTLRMPQPLLDRMEIIRLAGYTEDEKVEIAKRHLIPKQRKEHGLKDGEWAIEDEALLDLIRYYTREAGVRSLEREIANLARKSVKEIVGGDKKSVRSPARTSTTTPGVRKYRYGEAELEDQVGVVTGLAWTEVGGELLSIEAVTVPGKGKMTITGKLGDVMQESVAGREVLRPPRAPDAGHQAGDLRQARHPHPRARGGDAQGRPLGRHRDGELDRLGPDLAGHRDARPDRDPGQHRDDRGRPCRCRPTGRPWASRPRARGRGCHLSNSSGLIPSSARAPADEGLGRLDRLLHHVAELAGGLHLALAGHGDRLDRQQLAADLGPGEAGDRADLVLFLALAVAELAHAGDSRRGSRR